MTLGMLDSIRCLIRLDLVDCVGKTGSLDEWCVRVSGWLMVVKRSVGTTDCTGGGQRKCDVTH